MAKTRRTIQTTPLKLPPKLPKAQIKAVPVTVTPRPPLLAPVKTAKKVRKTKPTSVTEEKPTAVWPQQRFLALMQGVHIAQVRVRDMILHELRGQDIGLVRTAALNRPAPAEITAVCQDDLLQALKLLTKAMEALKSLCLENYPKAELPLEYACAFKIPE